MPRAQPGIVRAGARGCQTEAVGHGADPRAGDARGTGAAVAPQLLSPEAGCLCPWTPMEKVELDHRSLYAGNVDYGGTAEELGAHFSPREFRRITILCAKFSGHPKGSLCIELDTKSSAQAAVGLDETIAPRRVIKVLPKRTSLPGIRSTDRGGFRGQPGAGGGLFPRSGVRGGAGFRSRRRNRGRGPRGGGSPFRGVRRAEGRVRF
ncbi:embryonic polyadenylate-binding protein 2 [Neovison vison]|uniref:embryonic polyadenylate-binding protein 2 n=1 Tax=Neovison vison TaxID=452646 RepID=UPI001CF016E0|nr:embryonic polyadenylate-binding protein 2 [Neogale vison]